MKFSIGSKILAAVALTCVSSVTLAADFFLDGNDLNSKRSSRNVVLVGFSGDETITDAQTDVSYNPELVSVSVKAFGQAGCSNPRPGLIRVVSPDMGGAALGDKVGAYCQITVSALKGQAMPRSPLTLANTFCSGTGGLEKACGIAADQTAK